MHKLLRLSDNAVIEVAMPPAWRLGIWECGDQRFIDEKLDQYESIPDPLPVPESVDDCQARFALLGIGITEAMVDAAIDSLSSPTREFGRVEWGRRSRIRRDSQLVSAVSPLLGLTDAQVDDLFRTAATL